MRRPPLHLALFTLALFAFSAEAATFTVTSNASSGAGTLREAITQANAAAGADTIQFAIGSGEQTIQLTSALPAITDALTIDGTTQPGYTGTQLITVRGGNFAAFSLQAATTIRALILEAFEEGITGSSSSNVIDDNVITLGTTTMHGISLTGAGNTITGNNVNVSLGSAIVLSGANNIVQGNTIHGDTGLSVSGSSNQIGGTTAGAGNTITGNDVPASISGTGHVLQGNQITGNSSLGALQVSGSGHTIGGTTSSARNYIIGNPALQLDGTGNTFAGNYFNLTDEGVLGGAPGNIAIRTGASATGNTFGGSASARNYIVGQVLLRASNNTFDRNVIGGDPGENPADGFFWIESGNNTTLTNNLVLMPLEIYAGTGHLSLGNTFRNPSRGVELEPFQSNDPGDADTGPNNYQNSPEISATDGPGGSTITGTLSSTPSTMFTIEFFNGPACLDANPLGTTSVTTNSSGTASFTFNTPVHTSVVTAAATDPGNNTSPMALCVATSAPPAQVSINNVTANEDDGIATFTVTLSPSQSQNVVVNVATQSGTATQNADFTAVTTSVTFEPGQATKSVEIPILDDELNEPNETFTVTLTKLVESASYTITDGSGQGTIIDDDVVLITVDDASASESAGSVQVPVRLSRALSTQLSMSYNMTQNTANAGQDFTPSSGTLTFAPGETEKSITAAIVQDQNTEGLESFFVNVFNVSGGGGGAIAFADAVGEVTILDDDVALISILDARVAEGEVGAEVMVTLSMPLGGTLSVQYMLADGTATAGLDYVHASGTLVFAPGETSKGIPIVTLKDALQEPTETLLVHLSNPSTGTIVHGVGTVQITNVQPPMRKRAVRK